MKITHHYKSIISALAALALFYSAAPRAGILDGGEIQFHGLVTDEAPKWTWQVGSPDQTWAVDTADARTANGQLVFDLRGKGSLPFLEGHLYEVAERGGPVLPLQPDNDVMTVWTDCKRGRGVEFMRIGETKGVLHARSPLRSCTSFHLLWPVCGKTFTFSN